MSKVISIINWKGGVGKTSLTHHLGVKLPFVASDKGKYPETEGFPKTLLIDLDPQCSLSIACLGENVFEKMVFERKSSAIPTVKILFDLYLNNKLEDYLEDYLIYCVQKKAVRHSKERKEDFTYKYIDLLPSHPDLIYTDMEIAVFSKATFGNKLMRSEIYKFQIVHTFIKKFREHYDFIFIDCPPNLNYITQNAIYESDFYLIPTILDTLSSYGILSITNKVDGLNKDFTDASGDYKPTELAGIVANNVIEYYKRPKKTQLNMLNSLKRTFGDKVFKSYLTNGDGIPKALVQGYPVFALEGKHDNATKQSRMLNNIAEELWERIK